MSKLLIEEVLSNWIREATSSEGELLPKGIEPAKWVTKQFLNWWRGQAVATAVDDAVGAGRRIRTQLERLGGYGNPELGEAMHELIHLTDALVEIEQYLGLANGDNVQ